MDENKKEPSAVNNDKRWNKVVLKQIRNCVLMFAAIFSVLTLTSCVHEYRHTPHGEIRVTNDTDTQVSFIISSDKYSRLSYTLKPGANPYLLKDGVRIRVSGRDSIHVADWGGADIGDIANFYDGIWNLSIRQARRELRR